MELFDFQKAWEKLCDKACMNYTYLSQAERVWFNIQCLIQAVDNGGMISFFYNSGADYYIETIEDLKILKHEKIVKLLEKIRKIFPEGDLPKDMNIRSEIISSYPDGEFDEMYEEIDNEFYDLEKKLEEDLVNFILENKLNE